MNNNRQLRQDLHTVKRIVVKIGTRTLVDKNGKPNHRRIQYLVNDMAHLHKQGYEVIFVSSGSIGAGVNTLGMSKRPTLLPELQMAAAVGQTRLLSHYNECFNAAKCTISQVLLTHDDLHNRKRHLNARNTLLALLRNGIIPIVNENDVVSVDDIKVGDNDVLAALVSVLIDADLLIMLTTPNGLQKPIANGKQQRIPFIEDINDDILKLAHGKQSELSTGGMLSKLEAAKTAAITGTQVVIASGGKNNVLTDIIAGKDTGTLISPTKILNAPKRKHWITFFHRAQGTITIDAGAVKALCQRKKSLLPAGITKLEGKFGIGAMVNIVDQQQQTIGHGLVSFDSDDIQCIKGQHSRMIAKLLGRKDYDEVIHRDNMIILQD